MDGPRGALEVLWARSWWTIHSVFVASLGCSHLSIPQAPAPPGLRLMLDHLCRASAEPRALVYSSNAIYYGIHIKPSTALLCFVIFTNARARIWSRATVVNAPGGKLDPDLGRSSSSEHRGARDLSIMRLGISARQVVGQLGNCTSLTNMSIWHGSCGPKAGPGPKPLLFGAN